jgi:hypothetical protein
LVVLKREGGRVTAISNFSPPKGLRADQVLTSGLFGLPTTTSDDLTQAIRRYSDLKGKAKLSGRQQAEKTLLFDALSRQLTRSETAFEGEIRREVSSALERRLDNSFDRETVNFEIIRQLRELALS